MNLRLVHLLLLQQQLLLLMHLLLRLVGLYLVPFPCRCLLSTASCLLMLRCTGAAGSTGPSSRWRPIARPSSRIVQLFLAALKLQTQQWLQQQRLRQWEIYCSSMRQKKKIVGLT